MKKSIFAAAALLAGMTAAHADEMPIKGTCTSAPDTINFTGSKMPIDDPLTGDFGVTQIFMDLQSYDKLGVDPQEFGPRRNGFAPMGFGELGGEVKTDPANDRATIRMSTGNFKLVFEGPQTYGLHRSWECKITPNF